MCRARGVQVVAQQPVSSLLLPVSLGTVICELSCIHTQQVMHLPSARGPGSGPDQMGLEQLSQEPAYLADRQTSQDRGCGGGHIGPGIDRQQPKQTRGRLMELPMG